MIQLFNSLQTLSLMSSTSLEKKSSHELKSVGPRITKIISDIRRTTSPILTLGILLKVLKTVKILIKLKSVRRLTMSWLKATFTDMK